MASPTPPFGLLPAGHPLITIPTSQPSPTSFLYAIPQPSPSPAPSSAPAPKPFSHLAVFLLPGISLPPGTAASIYLAHNPSAFAPGGPGEAAADFRFLGAVGEGKESAVFKLGGAAAGAGGDPNSSSGGGAGLVVIGINVEEAGVVAEKMQQLQLQHSEPGGGGGGSSSKQPSTLVLAQRIIQNAFNFLSGFSGQVGTVGGETVEVVPLKAFQEWWRRFESRVRADPSFLEREQD
ncbi:hypothetical protein F5X96DRAFT_369930 [Biscogniauxia mediterranea]|nr:hypothetical protein F5X96DRAFT_369930 [Biscogniauxia mediterranea]